MRRASFCILSGVLGCLAFSTAVLAGGHNTADYPLRVHIYQHNGYSHYYRGQLDAVDGEGRGNLYENGEPAGFDFGYRCGDRLVNSMGFETYYARWKKPGKELEILLPVMGKPGAAESCELDVILKNTAYYRHNGLLNEEPAAAFKEWMARHQYDPEHGLNEPTTPGAASGAGASAPE
jgi:hypothetical protein